MASSDFVDIVVGIDQLAGIKCQQNDADRHDLPKRQGCRQTPEAIDSGGLHLFVSPTGGRLWRMAYRFDGKQKQLSFGAYPAVSLKDARARRDEAKALLAAGCDPAARRKQDRVESDALTKHTFRALGTEYLAKLVAEGRADSTVGSAKWLLEDFAYPALGDRPVAQIKPAEVLELLKKVEGRGTFETARRLRGICSRVFRYAVSTQKAEIDPTHPLRGALIAPKTRHHSAIVEPTAIGALLTAPWPAAGFVDAQLS
ncbi:integrase arm-type DNA-binding domain-containing protein [Ancylobacter dichloromethanicus]|nr:integrase arm-type DNA-binding domain-containing protein [Ancylobacter dichloromethanicus]MBS7555640.1 integrase arm-type DNA-binding domain-containing protein [Ancylobacter dichloromethanicus]